MKKIKISNNIILEESNTILDAIQKITLGDYRFQLIIKEDKLLGTISDGDIRRSIIKGHDKNTTVNFCMNKNPIFGFVEKPEHHYDLLNSLDSLVKFLPIVNKKKQLRFIIVNEAKKTTKTALVMAGGFGKRLANKTRKIPKPLVKVKNKPILEFILRKLELYNYKKIFISTHFLHHKIADFIKKRSSNKNIEILHEKSPLGTAGALSLLPSDISDNLTMINGDILSNINLDELESFHKTRKNDITLCAANYKRKIPFGVITFNDNQKLSSLTEKPEINDFILGGIYCINKKTFKTVRKKKIDITDIIIKSQKTGKKIEVFPIFENWNDIGSIEDLKRLNNKKQINLT